MTLAGATGISGLGFNDTLTTSGNAITNPNVLAGRIYGSVSLPTWSATLAEMSSTFGATRFAGLQTTSPYRLIDIYGLLPTFTIDVAQDTSGTFKITEGYATGTLIDAAPITVEAGGTVMFISNGALAIDAPITLKGNSLADLRYDQHGGVIDPSAFSFGTGDSLTFLTATGAAATSSQGGQLKINNAPYTLVYSMAQLDAIDGVNGVTGATVTTYGPGTSGNYALAANVDASAQTYSQSVVNNFGGTFDGLGHSISNLLINATPNASNHNSADIGLFSTSATLIRDLDLANLCVIGHPSGMAPLFVGGLVGADGGGLYNDTVSGEVIATYTGQSFVGGVAGEVIGGTVKGVTSSASVDGDTGNVGGLIGELGGGTVIGSSASGAVTGTDGANVGGLVGNSWGTIGQSFATGTVTGGGNAEIGGLVGLNRSRIDQSYATGNVSGNGNGAAVGGLVGINSSTTDITAPVVISNSYATGKVTNAGTSYAFLGGLVGYNYSQIIDSYATGAVVPAPSTPLYTVGGLVGFGSAGGVSNSYWNTQTSGQAASSGGTGLTTAQLDGPLPTGFDSAVWTIATGRGPELKAVTGQ